MSFKPSFTAMSKIKAYGMYTLNIDLHSSTVKSKDPTGRIRKNFINYLTYTDDVDLNIK